jgi:phage tail sheath protein FI
MWEKVRTEVEEFLTAIWRQGGLIGATAEEAFYVRCDESTMTQNDLENGRLVLEVGVAIDRSRTRGLQFQFEGLHVSSETVGSRRLCQTKFL